MVIKDGMNVVERVVKRLFDVFCSFFVKKHCVLSMNGLHLCRH